MEKLDLISFIEANNIIIDFVNSSKTISYDDLEILLNLKDKELTNTFLEKYNKFTENQLKLIEKFIDNNLDIANRDFVSDLIDFSSNWGLSINYKKLLQFLSYDKEEEHFVVLSTVNYITENTKLFYIKDIMKGMRGILDNPNFFQNVQISAALCLFRMTQDESYLYEIKDWFEEENNREFLNNKMKLNYYEDYYFKSNVKSILL